MLGIRKFLPGNSTCGAAPWRRCRLCRGHLYKEKDSGAEEMLLLKQKYRSCREKDEPPLEIKHCAAF
jgi:hypothetical protein